MNEQYRQKAATNETAKETYCQTFRLWQDGKKPTVRKQIGKTTYIVRVHFSETAKETMEDKIKRMLREEVRKM